MSDVAWKLGDKWVLLTERSPRDMDGKEPMAVYYPVVGNRRFQYVMDRRPRGSQTAPLRFLEE